VNVDRRVAETGAHEMLAITIDPHRIASMVSEAIDSNSTTAVETVLKEGAGNRQRLVFETKDIGGRLESGKVQARRFCQWVKAVNGAVAFSPSGASGIRRTHSTPSPREHTVVID